MLNIGHVPTQERSSITLWGTAEVYMAEIKYSFSSMQNTQLPQTGIQQENTAKHH